MAAPVWVTPAGDLGKIVEGEFYQVALSATNGVLYQFHSGQLPSGIVIKDDGVLEGFPEPQDFIQGVPSEVGQDVTSTFIVRTTSDDGLVSDRVFTLTVTGQDAPFIDTLPPADLGSYLENDYVSVQLTATDNDPVDVLTWRIVAGSLPPGVAISTNGLISGYITPVVYNSVSVNTYTFTAEVTDGKDIATKEYTMDVYLREALTTDATGTFTDTTFLTTDLTLKTRPVLSLVTDLGTYLHDNYYSIRITATDFDGDAVTFSVEDSALPPGMTFNANSGWLSGYIPAQRTAIQEYNFAVSVYKTSDPTYVSESSVFTITVISDVEKDITWPASNLGIIKTGEISELDVIAQVPEGRPVSYELKAGEYQRLPQGLKLSQDGLLIGRVSFEAFMLDTGTTTFDKNSLRLDETTFDRVYTFTVRAFSSDGIIDSSQTFTVTVENSSLDPYESVYARAFPTQAQRLIYETLIQNADDIRPEDVYRRSDFNFGIQQDLRFLVATGLTPSEKTKYVQAVSQNHWNNVLRFNRLRTARALNSDGTVRYELVYAEMVDKAQGIDPATGLSKPVSSRIDFTAQSGWQAPLLTSESWPKVSSGSYTVDQGNFRYGYTNAIENMRTRIKTFIGTTILERTVLPAWMQSKQTDGTTPGWTLGVPIVYCKPGTADRIRFLLEKRIVTIDIKDISFEIDRYILDNNLSQFYDITNNKYILTDQTTFDADSSTETIFDGNGTKFYASVDTFTEKDIGDSYIKFPQTNIFR